MTDGPVHASAQIGSTLYIGGQFSTIRPRTGGGGQLDTAGAVDTAMPPVHGEVRAVAPDGAGGWYIGGLFDSVGGLPRSNLAHIRPDKSVDPDWAPAVNATVHAITVHSGVVFVGGAFTVVNGLDQGVEFLVGLDPASGALVFAGYTNGTVYALVPSGSALFAGGEFTAGRRRISQRPGQARYRQRARAGLEPRHCRSSLRAAARRRHALPRRRFHQRRRAAAQPPGDGERIDRRASLLEPRRRWTRLSRSPVSAVSSTLAATSPLLAVLFASAWPRSTTPAASSAGNML